MVELKKIFPYNEEDPFLFPYQDVTIAGGIGIGKCLKKGTKVLMYNGSIKCIEDIYTNELVMGDDSTSRKVVSCTRGRGEMFKITPIKGEPFTVNGDHIICLKRTDRSECNKKDRKAWEEITISVNDYIKQSNKFKSLYKLYRKPVNFSDTALEIDPYFLGLWLGDGNSQNVGITTKDKEIVDVIYLNSNKFGLKAVINQNKNKTCPTYVITTGKTGGNTKRNNLLELFKKYKLINNKHVPIEYKTSSVKNRLELLAGLIDTDGSKESNCLSFSNKNKVLCEDLAFVARSLGFYTKVSERITKCEGKEFHSYRVIISGDCSKIPCRLARKKCTVRKQKKNVLMTGFRVESVGKDEYYGFELDGNHKFLLGDFTVSHNSFVVSIILTYCTYLMGCIKDPQSYFGLRAGSAIQMMNMANNEVKAKKIVFGEVKARIDHSPWFKNRFNYKQDVTSELRFPNNIFIIPGNSADTFFEGFNIFGGVIDEADSHTITPDKDFAQEGYDAIKERIRSRFGQMGILMTIGSPKTTDGFLMKRYYEGQKLSRSYSVIIPYWECPSPNWHYSGQFFFYKNLRIPIEHKDEFDRNPEKALRDIAAVPTFAHQPFFAYPEKIEENANHNREVLKITNDYPFYPKDFRSGHNLPCVIHIDLGLNKEGGDKTGFAIGHSKGYIVNDGVRVPEIGIDLMEQIKAPPGGEILISDVRKRIYELKERGFNIVKVTFDGFQSTETMQNLNKAGIKSEILSVDKNTAAYEALKDCIYHGRLDYPPHPVFIEECQYLEIYGDKIDHQPERSKDLADAVAGVVYNIVIEPKKYNRRQIFKPIFGQRRLTVSAEVLND